MAAGQVHERALQGSQRSVHTCIMAALSHSQSSVLPSTSVHTRDCAQHVISTGAGCEVGPAAESSAGGASPRRLLHLRHTTPIRCLLGGCCASSELHCSQSSLRAASCPQAPCSRRKAATWHAPQALPTWGLQLGGGDHVQGARAVGEHEPEVVEHDGHQQGPDAHHRAPNAPVDGGHPHALRLVRAEPGQVPAPAALAVLPHCLGYRCCMKAAG